MIAGYVIPSIDSIKKAVSSCATCSPGTLETLILLLNPPISTAKATSEVRNGKRSNGPSSTATKSSRGAVVAKNGTRATSIQDNASLLLKPIERLKLATEVINLSLKALTEAIKAKSLERASKTPKSVAASRGPASKAASLRSNPPSPLQPRSPNRPSSSPNKSPKQSKQCSIESENIVALAECARAALAALRETTSSQENKERLPHLQVETGMSALIAKLLALEMIDLASRELYILCRRLGMGRDAVGLDQDEPVLKKKSADTAARSSKATFVDLLHVSQIPDDAMCLSLVTTTQLHILRLLSLKRRPFDGTQLADMLALKSVVAPVHLIESSTATQGKEKSAKQLGSLAQIILDLSRVPQCQDGVSRGPEHCSSGCGFRLQTLSLQIFWRSWLLFSHKVDLVKQVIAPLKKYLDTFIQGTTISMEDIYALAESELSAIQDVVATSRLLDSSNKQQFNLLRLHLYERLLDNVRERGSLLKSTTDVTNWALKSLQIAKQLDISKAKHCSLYCRAAMYSLWNPHVDQKESQISLLSQAIELLNGSLDGGSEDLDDLLANVSSLRKSVMTLIVKQSQVISKSFKIQNNLLTLLVHFIPQSLNFLIRYLGKDPGVKGANARLRFEKRLTLVSKVAPATIGNVTSLANMIVNYDMELWKSMDEALQNSAHLAKDICLDQLDEGSRQSKKTSAGLHVLISNIYWNRYLALKRQDCNCKALRQVLEKATSILSSQSVSEQSQGQILAKIERLGSLYETLGEWDTAFKLYFQALDFLRFNGDIDEGARKASTVNEFLVDEHYKTMARILEGHSRAVLRVEEVTSEMCSTKDAQQSTPVARGFLLEIQLSLLIKMMRRQKDLPKATTVVRDIAKELLDVYNPDDFPLRRLRTLCVLLECSLWNESLRSFAPFHEPIPENFSSLGHDMSLATYECHYRACFGALLALVGDNVDIRLLRSSLDIWEGHLSRHNGRTPDTLQKRIGDVEGILILLDTVEEYLYPLACTSTSITVLHLSIDILRTATSKDHTRLLRKIAALALQLIELGFTNEAGAILQEGRDIVELQKAESRVCFEWHRAYASYYVAIGTHHKSLEHIQAAERLLSAAFGSDAVSIARSPDDLLLLSHLLQISAKTALAMEQREKAIAYARKACGVTSRAWSLLERLQKSSTPNISEGNRLRSSLSHSETELATTTSSVQHAQSNSLPSTKFWPYVRPMLDGLLMLCNLLVNDGLFLESQHYLEQAENIASSVKESRLDVEVKIIRGDFLIRSGQTKLGVELLEAVDGILQTERDPHDKQTILLRAKLAAARALAPSSATEDSLTEVYQALSQTTSSSSHWTFEGDNSADTLARDLESLSMAESTHHRIDKRKPTKGRSEKPKKVTKAPPLSCEAKDSVKHSIPVLELLSRLLHLVFSTRLKQGKIEQASSALEEAAALARNGRASIMQSISKIHLLLNQTMSLLESDPVFNILSESTLASPVVDFAQSTQKDSSSTVTAPSERQAKKRSKTVVSSKTRGQDDAQSKPDLYSYLSKAVEIVASLSTIAHSNISTATLHHWSDMISKLLALASTVCISLDVPRASSVTLAHTLEVSRSAAIKRERLHIGVEKQLSLDKHPWAMHFGDDHDVSIDPSLDLRGFQRDFIDIIPNSWTAVSLSISDSYDELRICRLKANNTPFVICVPLGKKGIRESGDDLFGYQEAKRELKRIVDLANFSAHDAGDLSQKGAKTAWWEARAGLDSRLKDLLINIENIWFGGFRGAMKHSTPRTNLMARFQQTFVRIMEKHLPSRGAKAPKTGRVVLDSRVLELFVALGNPCDVQDIDEPILDLLYFVVDILQFNGERNAYDEIDFDPMVVDVQDALSHYHELAKADGQEDQDGHTILILDKKLHQFPWESLPCLAGQSISRLPSLTSLRDRILTLSQAGGIRRSSLSIDRTNGAYVLNPSGDLKHTQANLETPLAALGDWSATTNQAPTESELAATLATKSLYLYFGHGSGGQFIRSRTIRRLDQCAVALLMGCSSSSLTEAGEFEPYGTPINYLQAGAPAVVGTLWDVTDKDIDRFSMKLLERWGLFKSREAEVRSAKMNRSASPVKKAPRGKGRQRSRTRERERQDEAQLGGDKPATLDRAVAESRDACILRHLNGAAPVVYGIPISLS